MNIHHSDPGRPRPPVSFELFPPRSDAAAIALGRTIDRLAEVDPAFISVTFGAGGSTRDRSLTVLKYLLEHTDVEPLAHLTCVGSSHADAEALVGQFLDAGIRRFLALRGDPPEQGGADAGIGDLQTAAELVELILAAQGERDPGRSAEVSVAAFPNGHPSSVDVQQDVDALLAKEAAGATLAITQLFWHAEDYLGFVERARSGGVTIPILPGIMPVTVPARLARLAELTGVEPPMELALGFDLEPSEHSRYELGVEFAAALAREVLDGGAPGLHLYTFNRHEAVLDVIERLGQTQHISDPRRSRADERNAK